MIVSERVWDELVAVTRIRVKQRDDVFTADWCVNEFGWDGRSYLMLRSVQPLDRHGPYMILLTSHRDGDGRLVNRVAAREVATGDLKCCRLAGVSGGSKVRIQRNDPETLLKQGRRIAAGHGVIGLVHALRLLSP